LLSFSGFSTDFGCSKFLRSRSETVWMVLMMERLVDVDFHLVILGRFCLLLDRLWERRLMQRRFDGRMTGI
jgi:hypothetical protein